MSQMLKWAVAGAVAVAMTSVVCADEQAADTKATETKAAAPEKAAVQIVKSIFHKMDANNDGKVTAEERQARQKEWLKELDANGDGKLSSDEYVGQRFASIDVNRDNSVTMEEYLVFFVGKDTAADQTVACDKRDANGDNEISAVEVIAYRKSVFTAMDANGDGKVAPDEMKAAAGKKFKGLDADSDGFVTVEEMIAIIPVPAAAPKVEEKKAEEPAK